MINLFFTYFRQKTALLVFVLVTNSLILVMVFVSVSSRKIRFGLVLVILVSFTITDSLDPGGSVLQTCQQIFADRDE